MKFLTLIESVSEGFPSYSLYLDPVLNIYGSPIPVVHQLIMGKYGTSSICSPRMICEILLCFYYVFAEKSTSYLQLSDFILLSI